MIKTYSQKLRLNTNELFVIHTLSLEHRQLYNHLLGWLKNNQLNFKQLNSEYVKFRNEFNLTIPSKSAQNTCRVLCNSIKSYLSLKKSDSTAKFPYKFKSFKNGFTSFYYDWNGGNGGFKIINGELIILAPKEKQIKIKLSNYILSKINGKQVKIVRFCQRNKNELFVQFVIDDLNSEISFNKNNWLSIDLGLKNSINAVSIEGKTFKTNNWDFRKAEKQIDKSRSKLDKKKKYSKRYNRLKKSIQRNKSKISNKRKDYHHKMTKSVINWCEQFDIGTLIIGDIQTKSIKTKSKGLNRSMQNRGSLSRIKSYLAYKAELKDIDCILVNEAYTSKTNCLTGEIMKLSLSDRIIDLGDKIMIDRDFNGAINIACKALHGKWFASLDFVKNLKNVRVHHSYEKFLVNIS